eukprot:366106-Chlamydomonas_euryale.AAC.2
MNNENKNKKTELTRITRKNKKKLQGVFDNPLCRAGDSWPAHGVRHPRAFCTELACHCGKCASYSGSFVSCPPIPVGSLVALACTRLAQAYPSWARFEEFLQLKKTPTLNCCLHGLEVAAAATCCQCGTDAQSPGLSRKSALARFRCTPLELLARCRFVGRHFQGGLIYMQNLGCVFPGHGQLHTRPAATQTRRRLGSHSFSFSLCPGRADRHARSPFKMHALFIFEPVLPEVAARAAARARLHVHAVEVRWLGRSSPPGLGWQERGSKRFQTPKSDQYSERCYPRPSPHALLLPLSARHPRSLHPVEIPERLQTRGHTCDERL